MASAVSIIRHKLVYMVPTTVLAATKAAICSGVSSCMVAYHSKASIGSFAASRRLSNVRPTRFSAFVLRTSLYSQGNDRLAIFFGKIRRQEVGPD